MSQTSMSQTVPVAQAGRARGPQFPESQHPTILALADYSDLELLAAFQQFPASGRYFIALFCRYGALLHALAARAATAGAPADYLFAMSWRHIFYELRGLDVYQLKTAGEVSLRSWLVAMVGFCAQHVALPSAGMVPYSLAAAPPPLWCHLESALDALSPLERLTVLLVRSGGWTLAEVAAWMAENGPEAPSVGDLEASLQAAEGQLERSLPSDVRDIYLTSGDPKP